MPGHDSNFIPEIDYDPKNKTLDVEGNIVPKEFKQAPYISPSEYIG